MKRSLIGFCLGIAVMGLLAMNSNYIQQNDKSLARVEKVTGKYVFLNCEPVNDYDIAFDVEIKFVLSNSQINSVDKIANLTLNKAFKIAEEEHKEFDAIIIKGGQKKDLAIKFK